MSAQIPFPGSGSPAHRRPGVSNSTPAPVSTNLVPTHVNVPFGSGPNEVLDIRVHPAGCTGPVLVCLHSGGGRAFDHKATWLGGTDGMNALAWFLTSHGRIQLEQRFDVVSVNYEQWAWEQPTPVTHIAPYVASPNPTPYPGQIQSVRDALSWIVAHAEDYGWDVNKIHLAGSSQGGVLAMKAAMQFGLPVQSLIVESPIPDYRDPNIHVIVGEGMYGDATQEAWEARDSGDKIACSAIVHFENDDLVNLPPLYVLNAIIGDGLQPYGDPANEGSNIHDHAQYELIVDELTEASIGEQTLSADDWESEDYERGAWVGASSSAVAISRRVYEFLTCR